MKIWTDRVKKRRSDKKGQRGKENPTYRSADKSLARPTTRYILSDGENLSFDAKKN
jgi:hypothetical protein